MKNTGLFFLLSLSVLGLTTCKTYDQPLIYHKNFQPGTNEKIRLDGYYSEPKGGTGAEMMLAFVQPVFLYADGSVFYARKVYTAIDDPKTMEGSWGNYQIKGDSIYLERFDLVQTNYRRIILRGTIDDKNIHWTSRKDHNDSYSSVDYTMKFWPCSIKPDSTLNWTRKRKKYNQ